MLINTAVFGSLEVEADQIFHVPDGLFGFEGIRDYALISQQDDQITLRWFQSVGTDVPCFVVFDPFDLVMDYEPEVEKSDLRALKCNSAGDLKYLVIAVIPEDVSKATVNLKSPIAVNPAEKIARQIILANKDYPIRFPLLEEAPA